MDHRNIVLTGFMGIGKTSVGNELARILKRTLVDMDTRIQAREGMTIAQLFAEHGEGYFRNVESTLLRELAESENLVIAISGGALMNPENRTAFENARLVCLDASVDEIAAHLNAVADRPLFAKSRNGDLQTVTPRRGDSGGRIEELLEARRESCSSIAIHVNTNGRTPEEIARTIVGRLETRELAVRFAAHESSAASGFYPIYLGRGLLDHVGAYLRERHVGSYCAVITNPMIGALYAERVCASLRAQDFSPTLIRIPDGEMHKNLDTVRQLYDQFIEARLERRSPILALGGGVVGDTVGFAAATYLRGVPFVQIPTTLLSMVDSSVGGKVAVDHPSGKNLVGAFKFPVCVIADVQVLETLPEEEYRAGMAEVIKHAVIGDAELFQKLETGDWAPPSDYRSRIVDSRGLDLLERALRVKIDIVEQDPFEEDVRAHLNLGHTFGQAIERLANYELRHGYAVAMGMAVAARLAANIGFCKLKTRDDILAVLDLYGLPTHVPVEFSAAQVLDAMGTDKKIRQGKLRLVLPREIGSVDIAEGIAHKEILRALEDSHPF